MHNLPSRFAERVRTFLGSDWENDTRVRWLAQMAAGALPGLILMAIIMRMASQPGHPYGHGASAASVVPLLSSAAIVDSAAFHRLDFNGEASTASSDLQFRAPGVNGSARGPRHILTVTKRTSPLDVDFDAPRTSWSRLGMMTRREIDAGVKASAKPWQRIVLHGTASEHGALRLLDRYQSNVQGIAGGTPYHFVIGNGSGSADGLIEASARWKKGEAPAITGLGEGTIHVCIVGDFQHHAPTTAQLHALDELLDYLALKLGGLPLATHEGVSGEPSRCMGSKFPVEQVFGAAR